MSLSTALLTFLLSVTSVTLGGLYFDSWQKNTQLKQDVQRLKNSQVILSVSTEQAPIIVNWMNSHPEYVAGLIESVQSQVGVASRQSRLRSDNGLISIQNNALKQDRLAQGEFLPSEDKKRRLMVEEKMIAESAEGIKTIALPHGGIRITTR
ncbi:hypothetical protein [uncultured Shewanella sp.]|uniref:hypothetical protein n=1 Tax=uncultured Shewanella sp. TaxID=173975 RepID=UPI0026192557|nr:hypothetical protein [uncultured Shewanella sp.]